MALSTLPLLRIALAAQAIVAPLLSQVPKPAGAALYRLFFAQVSELKDPLQPVQVVKLNGIVVTMRSQALGEVIGLTATQAEQLRAEAVACNAAAGAIESQLRPVLLNARLDGLASEQAAAALETRMKDLQRRTDGAVNGCLETLRRNLGDEAFKKIESFVTGRPNPWSFFPLVPR